MHFTASQCVLEGLLINWHALLTVDEISSLVSVRY